MPGVASRDDTTLNCKSRALSRFWRSTKQSSHTIAVIGSSPTSCENTASRDRSDPTPPLPVTSSSVIDGLDFS